jgi:hypothetical protein
MALVHTESAVQPRPLGRDICQHDGWHKDMEF